jgi:catechol 2,3-dioxygenase-like lactoylglutathione lyase family enzyme|tara:strand:+ start:557 stop:1054 length:498 start_codon:yes stop_codon:yes gene_type:complete
MATLHHVLIPLENQEALNAARDFFVNVLGFVVERDSDTEGKMNKDEWGDDAQDQKHWLPDWYCHLRGDNGVYLDLVAFDGPSPFRGVTLGFEVANIEESCKAVKDFPANKDYPITQVSGIINYGKPVETTIGWKPSYFNFYDFEIGRDSEDGTAQSVKLCEMNEE